jgi:hypothetical protein
MRRALLGVAGCVLGLALTGTARAHEPGARPYRGPANCGVRFSGGYCYPAHRHPHWERRVWDAGYGRYQYWNPCVVVQPPLVLPRPVTVVVPAASPLPCP